MIMDKKAKRAVIFLPSITAAFILIVILLFSPSSPPKGAVLARDIVSSCVGDAENDGALRFCAISGNGRTEDGERCGEFLLICDMSAESDIESLGYFTAEKIQHRIDLSDTMPIDVRIGDTNGDGMVEVIVLFYGTDRSNLVLRLYGGELTYSYLLAASFSYTSDTLRA